MAVSSVAVRVTPVKNPFRYIDVLILDTASPRCVATPSMLLISSAADFTSGAKSGAPVNSFSIHQFYHFRIVRSSWDLPLDRCTRNSHNECYISREESWH